MEHCFDNTSLLIDIWYSANDGQEHSLDRTQTVHIDGRSQASRQQECIHFSLSWTEDVMWAAVRAPALACAQQWTIT